MTDAKSVHVVSAGARIDAPPDRVYAIIADYRNGHPRILPKQFGPLSVDEGGYGAGTVIRCSIIIMGRKMPFRAAISEPRPGRVLVESIEGPNPSVTTFTVEPGPTGQESDVTISTEVPARGGLAGMIERFITTRMLRPIYKDELALLAAVATAVATQA